MEDHPSPKRQSISIVTESIPSTDENEVSPRTWSDLPPELISPIAACLGIIELLSFRGSCKDFHAASSTASAEIESSPDRPPWFLLCRENSQCTLYNESNKKKYTITIPELDGTTCLASNQGWLLLFKEGSMFFFCPFSKARIDLPIFPSQQVFDHVAAFSSPPTSQDCILSVINRRDEFTVELNVLYRGDKTWTKHKHIRHLNQLATVTCAIYNGGTFYYLDDKNAVLTFCVRDKKWKPYWIVENDENAEQLPFIYMNGYFEYCNMTECLNLEDGDSVSTCGAQMKGHGCDIVIKNERIEASKDSEFPPMKGIWIQPRFLQIPPNMSW